MADAGLFARSGSFQRYPQLLPLTRITLGHYVRRPYLVRHARPEDLPELVRLEEACWPVTLRASPERIARRVDFYPQGQFILELDGRVAGVIYSQRIIEITQLGGLPDVEAEMLHPPNGPVLQLLVANVDPSVQQRGLGDQLLEFVLQVFAATAATRMSAGEIEAVVETSVKLLLGANRRSGFVRRGQPDHEPGDVGLFLAGRLSADGHCKTFDASADGYLRGDGRRLP